MQGNSNARFVTSSPPRPGLYAPQKHGDAYRVVTLGRECYSKSRILCRDNLLSVVAYDFMLATPLARALTASL